MFFRSLSLSSLLSVEWGRRTFEWMQLPVYKGSTLTILGRDLLIALEMSWLTFHSTSENFTPL